MVLQAGEADVLKTCRTCEEDKPISDFYVYTKPYKGGTRKSMHPDCKTCFNKAEYERQQEAKRLSSYVVRDWHGEVKLALAGLFAPPDAFVELHGVRRKQWGA